MILTYTLLGIITSLLGALPLGASNIAVINTTIKQNIKYAMKIAFTAAIAEVVLSFYALNYNMMVKDFFSSNQWLQILIALLLLGIGGLLFFKKQTSKSVYKKTFIKSKYLTGFLLGLLNPPVLVYWLLVFGIINNNGVMLSTESSPIVLILFFSGVYMGKLFTLYIYGRFSVFMQSRFKNINLLINKVTGSLLFSVGVLQFLKIYVI